MNNYTYKGISILVISAVMLISPLSNAEPNAEQVINWGEPFYLAVGNERYSDEGYSEDSAKDMVDSPLNNYELSSEPVRPIGFSYNKMHQYMGLSTLALVALTAVLPKDDDLHKYTATLTAASAAATAGGGLFVHWNDFDLSEGLTEPDNLHVLFAGLGVLAVIAAAASAPDDSHIGLGVVGGLSIGAAVKLTW